VLSFLNGIAGFLWVLPQVVVWNHKKHESDEKKKVLIEEYKE
jgi:hypothetical protein